MCENLMRAMVPFLKISIFSSDATVIQQIINSKSKTLRKHFSVLLAAEVERLITFDNWPLCYGQGTLSYKRMSSSRETELVF